MLQVWKGVYMKWHREMANRASTVVEFVKKCSSHESLEVADYLKAVNILCSLQLGFKDVQLYIFTKENHVLLNLIGLHYSIFMLGVQVSLSLSHACRHIHTQPSWYIANLVL